MTDDRRPGRPGGTVGQVAWMSMLLMAATMGGAAAQTRADYEQMLEGRYSPPRSVPEGGLGWELGGARFALGRGTVELMQPTSLGLVTGLVFEGSGRFTLEVPDQVELRQLRRFSEERELTGLELSVSRVVLRTSEPTSLGLDRLGEVSGPFTENGLAREHHADWRRYGLHDADARVVAALNLPGDHYLRAAMETEELGWLVFTYDELEPEEMALTRFNDGYEESWLALDRPDERTATSRPNSRWTDELFGPVSYGTRVDLTRSGRGATRGVGRVNPLAGKWSTRVVLACRATGAQAALLSLSPLAEVRAVRDSDGESLDFLRFHIGGMASNLPKDFYDPALTVLLREACFRGDEVALEVDYEMEIANFASLLSWYPTPRHMGFEEAHAVEVEITHRKDYAVKGMGELIDQREQDGNVISIWRTQAPVDAAAFTIARLPYEKTYEYDGLPKVTMFGTRSGDMSADKIESFSADIINAINFFQNLFGTRIQAPEVNVTFIASGHGQAGEGLIHISDGIAQAAGAGRAISGVREAFLAHEVAHEWWGHQLSWASYRDQWLSEGFAEYSAMMFVEASLEDGDRIFRNMLESYTDELTGSIGSAFGAFSRPGLALLNNRARERMGPIGHGLRAGVSEAPTAYSSMAYNKGAFVLHMLRGILRTISKSDELFFTVLRDFVKTHQGQAVSTEDFQAILSKHANSDWSWFFDQWVYGTAIPKLDWKYETKKGEGGKWQLLLDVEMTEVPDGWRQPVPVRAEFGGGKSGDLLVMVDQRSKRFELSLPAKPKKVVFNPDFAVLAKMK